MGRSELDGVGQGQWAVFAERVVAERDEARREREVLRAALQALVEAVDADGLRRHFPQLGRARWAYRAACDALKSGAVDEPR